MHEQAERAKPTAGKTLVGTNLSSNGVNCKQAPVHTSRIEWSGLEAPPLYACRLALSVSLWGPRPVGNSRDSHGLSFAGRWLQNMKPCPALPGLRPCREQLGFPMVSVLHAERGTMPSPYRAAHPQLAASRQKEQCQLQAFPCSGRGQGTTYICLFDLFVKCTWRLSGQILGLMAPRL